MSHYSYCYRNYRLQTEITLSVSLAQAHRSLQRALADQAGMLTFKHWSVSYSGVGFRVCRVNTQQSRIELSLNVYLSRLPFAKAYFERFVIGRLSDELQRCGRLSETLAGRHGLQFRSRPETRSKTSALPNRRPAVAELAA